MTSTMPARRPGLLSGPIGRCTVVGTWALLAGTAPAQAFNLGPAQDYNLFVLGNMEQHFSDVEGRVAVGGNLSVTDFDIGLKAPSNSATPNLIVGGSLDFNRGTVHGDTTYGQSLALTQVTPSAFTQQPSSTFFSQAGLALNQLSAQFMGLQGTSVSAQYGGLTLKGTGQLNVFNLSNIDWAAVKYLNIDAPSTSQVVVNIAGQSVKWQNMGFGLTGVARTNVLYNLNDATSLEANGVGIQGSILAPQASFLGYNGQYNGQAIFKEMRATPTHQASIQGNYAPSDPLRDPLNTPLSNPLGNPLGNPLLSSPSDPLSDPPSEPLSPPLYFSPPLANSKIAFVAEPRAVRTLSLLGLLGLGWVAGRRRHQEKTTAA
jgi:choice-of-anchor A domain-containing protein